MPIEKPGQGNGCSKKGEQDRGMGRPPVRPRTPPQLRLNLDNSSAKQREEYARDVLQQVYRLEAAAAQQGYGSPFISEDDKLGAINDDLAEAREEERWRQAREHQQVRCSMQIETARSNPVTEQREITFHPQPRRQHPHSARPAAASRRAVSSSRTR